MTVITSSNYWNIVFQELQKQVDNNAKEKYLLIGRKYDLAVKSIEDRIISWYGKHALNSKISLKLAYKKLSPEHLEQFKGMIEFYLRNWHDELGYEIDAHGQKVSQKDTTVREIRTVEEDDVTETDVSDDTRDWIMYLRECLDRDDITCYEALAIPIRDKIEHLTHDTNGVLNELLFLTGWVVFDSVAKKHNVSGLSQTALKNELLKAWASDGMTLYERMSRNKATLTGAVKSALIKGFKNEMSVNEVINEVSKVMGIGQAAARRLVVTENTHFSSYSTYLALKEAGYKYYKYVSRMTANTCEDCELLHGSVFPLEAYEEGVTAPSMHPYCVCYIVGEV